MADFFFGTCRQKIETKPKIKNKIFIPNILKKIFFMLYYIQVGNMEQLSIVYVHKPAQESVCKVCNYCIAVNG
jgi:hypothetical protein